MESADNEDAVVDGFRAFMEECDSLQVCGLIVHPQHTFFHAAEHHTLARASCRAFKCLQTLTLALAALPPSIWSMYTTSAPRLPS